MNNRRDFLKKVAGLAALSPFATGILLNGKSIAEEAAPLATKPKKHDSRIFRPKVGIGTIPKKKGFDRKAFNRVQNEIEKAAHETLNFEFFQGDGQRMFDRVFEKYEMAWGACPEFPRLSEEPAYYMPNHGMMAERVEYETDHLRVPTYEVGVAIDWLMNLEKTKDWEGAYTAARMMSESFQDKLESDAWLLMLGAAIDRNVMVFDEHVKPPGVFSSRLIHLMKSIMRRQDNSSSSASVSRGMLTDLCVGTDALAGFMVEEGICDEKIEALEQLDHNPTIAIFGVRVTAQDNLSLNRIYQTLYNDICEQPSNNGITRPFPKNKNQIVLGFDLSRRDGDFVSPRYGPVQAFPDDTMYKQKRCGMYCFQDLGMSIFGNKKLLLGAI